MKLFEKNGLNICFNKTYELILAILAVYLYKNPQCKKEIDYVESPNNEYMQKLMSIINLDECTELLDILKNLPDEGLPINIAISTSDDYHIEVDENNANNVYNFIDRDTLYKLEKLIKEYANKIKWDEFIEKNKVIYQKYAIKFSEFPNNLDLHDIVKFYSLNDGFSFNYIPSILMNGGFSARGGNNNLYYNRGFIYDEKDKVFNYDNKYLVECLFHEFSHPFVNKLIDDNFSKFSNIDSIYELAVERGLPKTYQNKNSLLYEYFVRANAKYLTKKYYPNTKFSEYILNAGFFRLNELYQYIDKNIDKYGNFNDLFNNELIDYFNLELFKDKIKKHKNNL